MGGLGSGRWNRWQGKKATVEESLVVAMCGFRGRLYPGASGVLTWTWTGGNKSSVGYFVDWTNDGPRLTLHYRRNDREDVQISVRLQTTPTQFGGERMWLTCPLIVKGVACNRRAGKLYLPPGARYFGCRTCHQLTYRSCQEAHQSERRTAGIDGLERWLAATIDRQR
jgi:hypothetical protein